MKTMKFHFVPLIFIALFTGPLLGNTAGKDCFLYPQVRFHVESIRLDSDIDVEMSSQRANGKKQLNEIISRSANVLQQNKQNQDDKTTSNLENTVNTTYESTKKTTVDEFFERKNTGFQSRNSTECANGSGLSITDENLTQTVMTQQIKRPYLSFVVRVTNETENRISISCGVTPVHKNGEFLGNADIVHNGSSPILVSPFSSILLSMECEIKSVFQMNLIASTGSLSLDIPRSQIEIYPVRKNNLDMENNLLNIDSHTPHWLLIVNDSHNKVRLGISLADALEALLGDTMSPVCFVKHNGRKTTIEDVSPPKAGDSVQLLIIDDYRDSWKKCSSEAILSFQCFEKELEDMKDAGNDAASAILCVLNEFQKVKYLFDEINEYWTLQDLSNVITLAKEVIDILENSEYKNESDIGKAYRWLGYAFQNTDRFAESAVAFGKSISYGVDCHCNLARVYESLGMPLESLKHFEEAYRKNPTLGNFYWLIKAKSLTPQQMLEVFEATNLSHNWSYYHYRAAIRNALAHQLAAEKMTTKATVYYDLAIADHESNIQRSSDADNAESYHWLAHWYFYRMDGKSDPRKALKAISLEIEVRQKFLAAYELRSKILTKLVSQCPYDEKQKYDAMLKSDNAKISSLRKNYMQSK